MRMVDTRYCYLSDANAVEFSPELYNPKEKTIFPGNDQSLG